MMFHILFIVLFLFVNVESEDVSQKTIKYQTLIDERFKEVYILLRAQDIQIKEQREKIGVLEKQIYNQNQRSQLETFQDDLRTKEIESLKDIVNRQQKEITEVKKQLAIVASRQIKCERNSMKLMDIISKQWQTQHKDKDQTNGPSLETKIPKMSIIISGDSWKNDRERGAAQQIIATAFYAYLSHHELNINNHHTLIFDTVKTNYNGGYSQFTGVFTVPVSGVYGFTYTVRMGCSRERSFGPFEIVRNSEVEGVLFFDGSGCNQVTVSSTVIIHANTGDNVYIRSHTDHPMDGVVFSDVKHLFSGRRPRWLSTCFTRRDSFLVESPWV